MAHQPVMDMAPRWEGGFGVQLRHESYGSSILLNGSDKVESSQGIERHVTKTWLEGVYTFDRSKRITFKLPYIDQTRIKNIGGVGVRQNNTGVGDLIIGFPLKKYSNQGAETGNISFTPSLRLPTGRTSGDFPLSDGSWDVGASLSYSKENYKYYQLYDLFYWRNNKGANDMQEGDEIGLDINWGIHPYHNNKTDTGVFLMWDVTARYHEQPNRETLTTASGGTRLHTGPVFVFYKKAFMFRAEYKFSAYEKFKGIGNAKGDAFQFGVGMTF